ncbi:hypothetical protein [Aeromonas hydrophila]|uniref:hypothetical protein n=1 Tax=Aeromonas hydrophila TaxID=644 RepID=UPI00068CD93F|nr:hypothetical protein [Aeromonas hydrophila]OFC44163.1 hypothetical protein BA189_19895 [Aeromonas hydrophila]OFC48699.1 hypothetical protein BA188_21815 [Aeromonas hydrophila]
MKLETKEIKMKMFSISCLIQCLALWCLILTRTAFAEPVLHVLFHMGAGANGQFFVGGTLENRGGGDIYQGFVVITPISAECYPLQPLLSPFGRIKVGQKYEFRIPIQGRLSGYKLDAVSAVDSFASPATVVDETADVIASKQKSYLARCHETRAKNKR